MVIMMKRQSPKATWSSLHALFLGKHIEFVAPFALEDCIARLEERSHRHSWYSWTKCLAVQVHRKDQNHYGFRLHKDAGHNLDVSEQHRRYRDAVVFAGIPRHWDRRLLGRLRIGSQCADSRRIPYAGTRSALAVQNIKGPNQFRPFDASRLNERPHRDYTHPD